MFSNPQKILLQSYIGEGMTVADIGAGGGYYSYSLAVLVGPTGKVYAVDVNKELLQKIQNEIIKRSFKNVHVVHADVESESGTSLPSGIFDRIFVANTLFQLEKKERLIEECRKLLRKNGRVVLVDWADSFGQIGPHPKHVVAKDAAVALFAKAGFVAEREIDAGEHHYGIVFTPHE